MKAVMNKNVIHNGKAYDKGNEISASDEGFEMLVKAGHAVPVQGEQEPMPEESGSQEQSESSGKPGKKSKK